MDKPNTCDCCERELEENEQFIEIDGNKICMNCLERIFNETFPTKQ